MSDSRQVILERLTAGFDSQRVASKPAQPVPAVVQQIAVTPAALIVRFTQALDKLSVTWEIAESPITARLKLVSGLRDEGTRRVLSWSAENLPVGGILEALDVLDVTVTTPDLRAMPIKLRPQDIALAASAGLPELPVYRRVRVGVFFTGDELVQPGEPLPPGGSYNSNRYARRALLEGLGCEVRDLGTVPDQLNATREALRKAAADNDLIITSGGVSVGEEDHVKPAVEAEGQLDMWKIAIKPGKPLAFGEVRRSADHGGGKAWFIGLPGNPVSAIVTFMIMVRPFVLRLQGVTDVTPRAFNLRADFDWLRPDVRAEFLRARINDSGDVELYPNQGAGVVTSLCWGDGLVCNKPGLAINRGDSVRFVPFAELLS